MAYKKSGKRVSIVLAGIIIVSLLAVFIPTQGSYAAADDMLTEMGFDKNSTPDGYTDDGSNPYGRENVTMHQVSEIFVSANDPANAYDESGSIWRLYGHNEEIDAHLVEEPTETTSDTTPKFDAYLTASGDFTGSGKKAQTVAIGANTIMDKNSYGSGISSRSDAGLFAWFIDATTGVQTEAKTLLAGAIGNPFELNNGYLSYDPQYESTGGGESGSGCYNPTLLYNYMQVVTGDFTGDGIDEIAFYIPEYNKSRIEVYQLQVSTPGQTTAWQNWANWSKLYTYNLPSQTVEMPIPNRLSLQVGDMNYDGIDDLALGVGSVRYSNTGVATTYKAPSIFALFGTGNSQTFESAVSVGTLTDAHEIALTFGDLTGTGRDALIIVTTSGNEENDGDDDWYAKNIVNIAESRYNPDSKAFATSQIAIGQADDSDLSELSQDIVYGHVRADAVAVSPGIGMADNLYYRGFLWYMGSEGAFVRSNQSLYAQYDDALDNSGNSSGDPAYFEYGAVATDVDNDFTDEIMLYYNVITMDNDGPLTMPTRALLLKQDESESSPLAIKKIWKAEASDIAANPGAMSQTKTGRYERSCIFFATPDTDADTMSMTFKDHKLVYSDPKVLAVIAGAPLYKDLEPVSAADTYIGESGTNWATSKGSGTGTTNSSQFNIGAYFGYEHEVSIFGASLFSIEFEAEYQHSITWETEKKSTVTESVEYSAAGYTDAVALYSVPISIYTYEAQIPTDTAGGYEMQEFYVNIPYSPAVTVMEADEYDKIVANYADLLPTVRGNILTHTQGEPATYPKSAAGLRDARVYSGNFANVGYGSGQQTQTISIENEETKSTTHEDSISFKIGGGAGGVKAGITVGGAWGYGKSKITTSGSEFSGTVFNMPAEAKDYGYVYSWKIMNYWHYTDEENKIPVVSYIVEMSSTTQPLTAPKNPSIDPLKSTTDSLTLQWSYPTGQGIDRFQVYRYNEITEEYEPLVNGSVAYDAALGEYTYVDTGLSSGTQYSYKVQALRKIAPTASVLSETASGWTKVSDDIKLTLSIYTLVAYPDLEYTVSSRLTSVAGAGTATYAWEKYTDGEWKATGVNTSSLKLNSVKLSDTGEYRLRATQQIGNSPSVAYSPILTVELAKRTADIQLNISESGDGKDLILEATLKNTAPATESGSVPEGIVSFEVSYQNGKSASYTKAIDVSALAKTGMAAYTIAGAADGVYTVTASYAGNSIFQSASVGPEDYLKGATGQVYAAAQSTVYYGDTLSPGFFLAEKDGDMTILTALGQGAAADYSVALQKVEVQKVSTGGFLGNTMQIEFIPAVSGTDYDTANGTDIIPLNLDLNNFNGYGEDYHYIAYYEITKPDTGTEIVEVRYIVNKRPVQVYSAGGEIELDGAIAPNINNTNEFTYTTVAAGSAFAFNKSASALLDAVLYNNQGYSVDFADVSYGQYTVSAVPKSGVAETNYYDFSVTPDTIYYTAKQYAMTLNAGENGDAFLTSHSAEKFTAGTKLVFTALPDLGYEVDTWHAYIGGQNDPVKQQAGGTSFSFNTLANTTRIEVTFKEKDTSLSYEALPTNGGSITAEAAGIDGNVSSGTNIMEGSAVVLTAAPQDGYTVTSWYVYVNNSVPAIVPADPDPDTGEATLAFGMYGSPTIVNAMFTSIDEGPGVVKVQPAGDDALKVGDILISFSVPMDTAVPGIVTVNGTELSGGTWLSTMMYSVPYDGLQGGTEYTISISGFADLAGTVMDEDATHRFKTMEDDVTKPLVSGVTPSANAALSDTLYITFNEKMDSSVPGTVSLDGGIGDLVTGTWLSENVYMVSYSGLSYSSTYGITISGFADISGNVMETNGTYGFTTIAPVKTVMVGEQQSIPNAGAGGTVSYSLTTANIASGTSITLNDPSSTAGLSLVTGSTAGDDTTLEISVDNTVSYGIYSLSLTIDGMKSNNFVLVVNPALDTTNPTVTGIAPSGTALRESNILITFDEPMDSGFGSITITSTAGVPVVIGADGIVWLSSTACIAKYGPLDASTVHTISVAEFRDLAGNVNVPEDGSFTTGAAAQSIYIGQQTSPINASQIGGMSTVSFGGVTATGIPTGNYTTSMAAGSSSGFSADPLSVSDSSPAQDNITINIPSGTGAGIYPMAIMIDTDIGNYVTSNVFYLVVDPAPVQDSESPALLSAVPAGGGTPVSGSVRLVFSEDMDKQSWGELSLDDTSTGERIPLGSENGVWLNSRVYSIAYSGLSYNTEYTITILGGGGSGPGFKDTAGNMLEYSHAEADYRFTTVASPNASITVGSQKTQITAGIGGSASYDLETVDFRNYNYYRAQLYWSVQGVTLSGYVSIVDNKATININVTKDVPAGIYPLFITVDGVMSSSFTLKVDEMPQSIVPVVTAFTPTGSAAACEGKIIVLFDSPMDTAATSGAISLDGGIGTLSGCTWLTERICSVPYSGLEEETTYTATLSGFASTTGDKMVTDKSNNFTTVSAMAVTKSVQVGAQNGVLTAGIAGSANYNVSTLNIAAGSGITLNNSAGVAGISLATTATTGNGTLVAINTSPSTPAGSHTLTLTVDGVPSNSFTLTVSPGGSALVTGIYITGASLISTDGGTAQLTANVSPANAANKNVVWSIMSGGEYGAISSTGMLTAKANGTVTVRATAIDGSAVYGEHTVRISGQTTAEAAVINYTTYTGDTLQTFVENLLQDGVTEEDVFEIVNLLEANGVDTEQVVESGGLTIENLLTTIESLVEDEVAVKAAARQQGEFPWWIILLAALIIAGGLITAALIYRRKNKDKNEITSESGSAK